MSLLPGVFKAQKKNGELYYRASVTYKQKHISIGSYSTESGANQAYREAVTLLNTPSVTLDDYQSDFCIPFEKWVSLANFRDNGMYCKTPIYILSHFFLYYFSPEENYKFDVDDLFYYSKRKIQRRGNHLFVSDYGMQVNILNRYGIKNFAVQGRDYVFVNGDSTDFRYGNIKIINKYHGIQRIEKKGQSVYLAKIHVHGDYIIGTYSTETEAAVAYNKAANLLMAQGVKKNFPKNYVLELDENAYSSLYHKVPISESIRYFST